MDVLRATNNRELLAALTKKVRAKYYFRSSLGNDEDRLYVNFLLCFEKELEKLLH